MVSREAVNKMPHGIRILLLSHSLFWMAANLLIPFLSVFYVSELENVTLTEIGISALIYYLSFGLLEPAAGAVSDKISGLKDELFFIITAFGARGILFILLSFATNVWHLYVFQLGLGVFRAIAGPSHKVLYARFMGKKQRAVLWGLDESLVNISAAIGAGFGGYFAYLFGLRKMLVVAGVLTVISGFINLFLLKDLPREGGRA